MLLNPRCGSLTLGFVEAIGHDTLFLTRIYN